MQSNEAVSEPEPRIPKKKKSVRSMLRLYFLAVCSLFIMVLLLCMSNIRIYATYMGIKQQYSDSYRKSNVIQAYKREQEEIKESVEKQSSLLEEKNVELFNVNEAIKQRLAELERQNAELDKKNKELADDNVALQNTLKLAASVGIKPQNYTRFEGLGTRGDIDRGAYIGKFLGTSYTPSKEECGNDKGITNSGKPIIPGISVAVDPKYWPFGTVFYIKGLGYAVAMDTGSSIKGKYRFDFAVFDKKFANTLGERYWEVYLVKKGNGKVNELEL